MGYSISWLAMRAPAASIHESLGLRPTGDQLERPAAALVGAALSTGWYLLIADRCDHALIADQTLALVSAKADAVACSIEEHVMVSLACEWSSGTQVWSARHDAQRAIDHLELTGRLPAFAHDIQEQLLAQQAAEGSNAEVDFVFDVPLEIARRRVGFKHDAGGEPERFEVLELLAGSPLARKAWWKFW